MITVAHRIQIYTKNKMKVFLVACLVAVATAARLDNTYLPPQGAGGAGGFGLAGPLGGGGRSGGGGGGAPGGGQGRSKDANAQILRLENENDGLGNYHYAYETSNKIQAEEKGTLQNAGSENEAISAQGSFAFAAPDGSTYSIKYIADENGFQPIGDHLPTSPPIPEAILKSIQQNLAEEAAGGSGGAGGAGSAGGSGFAGRYVSPSQSFSSQSGYKY